MMQPTLLPWQGYFELIAACDTFMFLDDFQFSLQSYQQRNRLFVNKGQAGWHTVPVLKAGSYLQPLNQTVINNTIPWREKFWRRITNNYSKADYFTELGPQVESWLFLRTENLAELNIGFIKLACHLMDIHPKFLYSSDVPKQGKRSQLILEFLRKTGATKYFCARGSFDYMFKDKIFPVDDVELQFQDYNPLPYKQVGTDGVFVPSLSILDALFNIGPKATLDLIREGKSRWVSWSEMKEKYAGV